MYGLTLGKFHEDMNIPFRALFKILRYLGRWDERVLGIEHVVRLGYSVHHVIIFIDVVGYNDIDLVQREVVSVNVL